MNKIIAVRLILIAVGVLMYKLPQSSWQIFLNPDLGIGFDYPPGGERSMRKSRIVRLFFTGDTYQYVVLQNMLRKKIFPKCPQPKIIQNNAYCRLFENGSDYMYEFVALTDGLLQQVTNRKKYSHCSKIQGVHDLIHPRPYRRSAVLQKSTPSKK